jgi:hypothetical protein
MSGFDRYSLCLGRPSMGTFAYAQNVYHAWSQVHVDETKLHIKSRGVNPETREIVELYSLTINNQDSDEKVILN